MLSYPTVASWTRSTTAALTGRPSIRLFLEEMHDVLEDTGTALSIQLPEEVILSGADEAAGLVLSDIAPLADRICAATTAERIPQLEAAVAAASDTTDFAAELTAYESVRGGQLCDRIRDLRRTQPRGSLPRGFSALRPSEKVSVAIPAAFMVY